jgi:hypothetical protein
MHFISCEGVTIRNCDILYGGGRYQYTDKKLRFGNGIEFWEGVEDCMVEYCRIGEIYDCAVTNQGGMAITSQETITYRNNIFWNCQYSYECFDKPEQSIIRDVYFVNNTCIGAGFGWSLAQRYDPHGWHITLWGNSAKVESLYILDNVFYESMNSSIYLHEHEGYYENMTFDYNYYYVTVGALYFHEDYLSTSSGEIEQYSIQEYAKYQQEENQDLHSIFQDKILAQEKAKSITIIENHQLLNDLFDSTDSLAQAILEARTTTTTTKITTTTTTESGTIPNDGLDFEVTIIIMIAIITFVSVIILIQKFRKYQ